MENKRGSVALLSGTLLNTFKAVRTEGNLKRDVPLIWMGERPERELDSTESKLHLPSRTPQICGGEKKKKKRKCKGEKLQRWEKDLSSKSSTVPFPLIILDNCNQMPGKLKSSRPDKETREKGETRWKWQKRVKQFKVGHARSGKLISAVRGEGPLAFFVHIEQSVALCRNITPPCVREKKEEMFKECSSSETATDQLKSDLTAVLPLKVIQRLF